MVQVSDELVSQPKFYKRNHIAYRLAHWPIWIWVFFIMPGPLIFDLFESGFDRRMAVWLATVVFGTGLAGLGGWLPGTESRRSIFSSTEDAPNPFYRRVCYTCAWSAMIAFVCLNLTGLVIALQTQQWHLRQLYDLAYFPMVITIWSFGIIGLLPRARWSTKNEQQERCYFYGAVWTVCFAQPVLWFLWAVLPETRYADAVKLLVFVSVLVSVGFLSYRGKLPRTRSVTARTV